MNKEYSDFKSMLECFLFRLRSANLQNKSGGKFNNGMNSGIEGYDVYKDFWNGKGGNGHAKSNMFQKQIAQWSLGNKLSMAIKQSQSVKDYTDRANYVYWLGQVHDATIDKTPISINIASIWNQNKSEITHLVLYYSWNKAAKQYDAIKFDLKSLGLYRKPLTPDLIICFNLFSKMFKEPVILNNSYWENEYNRQKNNFIMQELLLTNYNLILTGAPGTGKTYLALEIAATMIGCDKKDLKDNVQFGFVQFHPSYDYTDFVEGLRPKDKGNGDIAFERKDGIFKAFCVNAAIAETEDAEKVKKQEIQEEEKRKFVFVIDEINRGEISKIFGELFFSIDPGYRKPKDRIPVNTQYQNLITKNEKLKDADGKVITDYPFIKGFHVPSNVYIIGTMNDIDRSVESMDFAFRRRFAFYEILAKDRQEDILSKLSNKDEAIKKMTNLNAAIEKQEGFGPSYHIGPAYFKQIEKYNGDWEQLWKNHLYGVLFEYLRGVPDYKTILNEWKVEFDK